jgi:hypothetical protein
MWYRVEWRDGKIEYIRGESISDAFMKAGYGGGAVKAIDNWCEAKELPMELKTMLLIEGGSKGSEISKGSEFHRQALAKIDVANKKVTIVCYNNRWDCEVAIEPFVIILTCTDKIEHGKPGHMEIAVFPSATETVPAT